MKQLNISDILSYCKQHSSPVGDDLLALERETHLTTIAPQMSAGPFQGMFLEILSRSMRPERILEIGTFTAYATICLARGLPEDGELDTIEVDPEREAMIRKYLDQTGLSDRVHVHLGDARAVVENLPNDYQLIYVDAGKQDYPTYYEMCLAKLARNGLLIFDNVLWSGKVIGAVQDGDTRQMQEFNARVATDARVKCIMLPIRDGMTLITKL